MRITCCWVGLAAVSGCWGVVEQIEDVILLCVVNIMGFVQEDGKLDARIEALLNEEKQVRLAADVAGTKKVVTEIIRLCYEGKAWKTLNEQILLLSKRRSQLKQVRGVPIFIYLFKFCFYSMKC